MEPNPELFISDPDPDKKIQLLLAFIVLYIKYSGMFL